MTPRRRIIPIFVPHYGCPNDCVFCNQNHISGHARPGDRRDIAGEVLRAAESIPSNTPFELAFYGGSFTAISDFVQGQILQSAAPFLAKNPENSVRVSTRPDALDRGKIDRLARYGVRTVELGAQSMCNAVLSLSRRGHTAADTRKAAALVKSAGLNLVLQMMTGLPGDSREKSLYTAEEIIRLAPDGVRVYPTVIIRDSGLFEMWRRGEYAEHSVPDAVSLCAEIVPLFEAAGIPVIRLGLNPTEELSGGAAAGGAYHPAFGELVYARIFLNRARELLRGIDAGSDVTLGVRRSEISKLVGQRRENIKTLMDEYGLCGLHVKPADTKSGEISILHIVKTL